MRKMRKFADGGETDPDVEMANASDDPIASMNKSKGWTGTAAKPKVVTKEALAKSGLSLRDYMNKQQGLTRRKEANPTLGEARNKAEQDAADAIDPGAPKAPKAAAAPAAPRSSSDETKMSLSDRMKLSRERSKSSSTGTDTRSVSQRIRSAVGMKSGGSIDGMAQRGKTRGKIC